MSQSSATLRLASNDVVRVWMSLAWQVSITLIGLPLAIWMYNRVPAVTTLKRY